MENQRQQKPLSFGNCNRRADFPLYEVYIQEVLDGLTAESFGKQLWLFEKF